MNTEVEDNPIEEQEQIKLNVDVDHTSACGRHVTVTIPREEIERYFAKQFDELVPQAEVPGFRPGKAPRKLVEKKFRKQLTDRVKGQLIMDSLAQVNETEDFSAISEPDLDYEKVKIPEEGDFKYEFNIEVRPEFELPKYKGLELTRPEYEFTDKDIDSYLTTLGMERADLVPVEEPAKLNDKVVCKVTVSSEGEPIATHDEVVLPVVKTIDFADAVIEDFHQLVEGASAGDTRTTKTKISEYSEKADLRGKEVEVEVEILDVKRPELPSDDELAEHFGLADIDALREEIKKALENRLRYAQRQTVRDQITDALTESATWELPQDLLERQAKRELQRAVMEMRSSSFSHSEIVARENAMRKDIHSKTAVLLKEHFVLERIAEEEEIEDSPQDYELEIMKIAIQSNDSPRRVRSRLERTGQMDSLRNMIIESKVIELITENATITGTDYQPLTDQDDSFSTEVFLGGRKREIPEAKYEGGEAPSIPGMDKDKK